MRRSPWQTPGRWVLFFTLVGSVGVLGCGGSGSVSGSVTYDGKPLPGGNVAFVSAQGGPTLSATIDSGGNYTIGKIPSGTYKVTVETSSLKPPSLGTKTATPRNYGPPAGAGNPAGYKPSSVEDPTKRYVAIPAEYESITSSGLEFKVKAGSQTINIPLTKK